MGQIKIDGEKVSDVDLTLPNALGNDLMRSATCAVLSFLRRKKNEQIIL